MTSDSSGHDTPVQASRGFTVPSSLDGNHESSLSSDLAVLGALLDDTLRRQISEEFLETLENVRRTCDENLASSMVELEQLDLTTASQLVRAFSMYFHLANVAEQTHRGRQGHREREMNRGPLDRVTTLIDDALREGRLQHSDVVDAVQQLDVRPVFTAHPTEAARRSVLIKLRAVSDLLEDGIQGPHSIQQRRLRRAAEVID